MYPDTAIIANPPLLRDYLRRVYSSLNFGKTLDDTQYKGSFWIDNNSRIEPRANGQYSTVNGDLLMIKQLNEQNELTLGIGVRYTCLKILTTKANYYTGMQPFESLAYERVQREQIYNLFSQLETTNTGGF